MNFKLNKRAILSTVENIAIYTIVPLIILQVLHNSQLSNIQSEIDTILENTRAMVEEYEVKLSNREATIQQLTNDNLNLKTNNEELQNEVDELNKVVRVIADNLNVSKEKVMQNPKIVVSRGGGDWRTFTMTHYQPYCKGCNGITYTEVNVKNSIYHEGMRIIAVDPKVIPINSVVEIKREDGSKFVATAQDVGGKIKGKKVDLLVANNKVAIEKGVKTVQLRIIKVGD